MFIDSAKIFIRSGSGGNGIIHWRREKFIPKGGPDGGNGGKGGDVFTKANKQLTTLLDFKYKRRYIAKDGNRGEGSNKEGRSAEDLIIQVPCGTIIRNIETEDILADLTIDGDEFLIAKGGRGGKGNSEFATPSNRAPRIATNGESGIELNLELELKLLADAGLVGLSNVGKSTLISTISAARPKIGNYLFTTLVPNLGMVYYKENASFVVADIPGLIEGAHSGKGLGIQFLKHIERTKILVYLLDGTSNDILKDFKILQQELFSFNKKLPNKKSIVAITKLDILSEKEIKNINKIKFPGKLPIHYISSITKNGIPKFISQIWKTLQSANDE
ncbi:MAG: GTPase ObgE [Bacteroidetes bacterium]|nr:GTPase ObgE [Bacteroidota bacterium]